MSVRVMRGGFWSAWSCSVYLSLLKLHFNRWKHQGVHCLLKDIHCPPVAKGFLWLYLLQIAPKTVTTFRGPPCQRYCSRFPLSAIQKDQNTSYSKVWDKQIVWLGLLYSVKKGWDLVMWQYKKERKCHCVHSQAAGADGISEPITISDSIAQSVLHLYVK